MLKKGIVAICASVMFLVGCSSTGGMPVSNGTDVALGGNNYKVVQVGARGESSGFYLLGLIPIVSPNYADAKSNLYTSVNTPLEGRSVALANQTEDRSTLYLILFSIPRLTVTADIVEFNDEPVPIASSR